VSSGGPQEFVERPFSAPRLTPDQDEPLTASEQLAAAEADIEGTADPDLVVDASPPPLGRDWAFDPVAGGFSLSPAGGPQPTYGLATLRVWIDKCLHTARGAHPIYGDDYGLERPFDLIGLPLDDSGLFDYEGRVRRALTYHPRITGIRGFSATPDSATGAVEMRFEVVLDDSSVLASSVRIR
jgi:hypothetical protein